MKEDLKYRQKVEFNIEGSINGTGRIVGKSLNDLPIIGGTYIIEPDESIRCETYDFTHFTANETQFKLI